MRPFEGYTWVPAHVAQRETVEVSWTKLQSFLNKVDEQRAKLSKARVLPVIAA